jgi:hypothetical protein
MTTVNNQETEYRVPTTIEELVDNALAYYNTLPKDGLVFRTYFNVYSQEDSSNTENWTTYKCAVGANLLNPKAFQASCELIHCYSVESLFHSNFKEHRVVIDSEPLIKSLRNNTLLRQQVITMQKVHDGSSVSVQDVITRLSKWKEQGFPELEDF